MRYLKLFEQSYYQELSNTSFRLEIFGGISDINNEFLEKWQTFTKEEVNRLKSLFPKSNIFFDNQNNISDATHAVLRINNLQITKLSDEWYFVFIPDGWDSPKFNGPDFQWNHECDRFYKCDQFEGLLKFLKGLFVHSF